MIDTNWHFDDFGNRKEPRKRKPLPAGYRAIADAKPRSGYCHYSNPASQGALICETKGFPQSYNPQTEQFSCAYSDRIAGWDYSRFAAACKIAGGGEQAWAYRLPSLSDDKLKEFAKVALDIPCTPTHVRVVHWFNVSNGYSCPTVEAVYPKQEATPCSAAPSP